MKVNFNLPDELVAQIDERAKKMFITRTAWVITAISQKLQGDVMVEQLPEILRKMQQESEK